MFIYNLILNDKSIVIIVIIIKYYFNLQKNILNEIIHLKFFYKIRTKKLI